jgi:NAD(P)-dependent dehydrogenase (short-subunit alcohol dehydrogenase family)
VQARYLGDGPHCGRRSDRHISSISALRPRGLTTYTVSKGAVIALTKAIAVDHTGHVLVVDGGATLVGPSRASQ